MGDKSLDGGIVRLIVLDDDGKIEDSAREDFIARTQDVMMLGPASAAAIIGVGDDGTVNVAEAATMVASATLGALLAGLFGRDSLEEHQEDFEAFHRIMIDGIWEGLANGLNLSHGAQPGALGMGTDDDIWDPTEIIAAILALIPDLDIEIDLPTLIPNLPAICLLLPGLGSCEELAEVLSMCQSEKSQSDIESDLGEQEVDNGDGTSTSFCDTFPLDIGLPIPPNFSFEMPEIPLPDFTIPSIGLPVFPISISLPDWSIPSIEMFAIKFVVGFPAFLAELFIDLPPLIIDFLTDILAFIEWVIERIIAFLMTIFEKIAEYYAFIAAIVVILHDLVIWIVVGSIFYFIGPGMIIESIASILS